MTNLVSGPDLTHAMKQSSPCFHICTMHWYKTRHAINWCMSCAAAFVTGPYALSRLTWAGLPVLALVLACHYYCAMLMVSINKHGRSHVKKADQTITSVVMAEPQTQIPGACGRCMLSLPMQTAATDGVMLCCRRSCTPGMLSFDILAIATSPGPSGVRLVIGHACKATCAAALQRSMLSGSHVGGQPQWL